MPSITITTPGAGAVTVGGSGTNDIPAGVSSVVIECWGNGASSPTSFGQEGGGASGAYARRVPLTIADGDVLGYTIPAGKVSGDVGSPDETIVMRAGLQMILAIGASNPSNLSVAGPATTGAVVAVSFAGAPGKAAQSAGGSRGGSGGSSSAGPSGPGVQGAVGAHSLGGAGASGSGADAGFGGGGAAGGVANLAGGDGSQPGGGAGGGGSGANSNGGRGGAGQIRISW